MKNIGTLASVVATLLVLSMSVAHAQPQPPLPPGPVSAQQQAVDTIEHAYDALERTAVLAQNPPANQDGLLPLSRATYQEALSLYQKSDYEGARETAMAAADIARSVEQETLATVASAELKEPLPPPPTPDRDDAQAARAFQDLARARDHEAQISADLDQSASGPAASEVRKLIAVSRQLEQRAETLLSNHQPEEAGGMARAADAVLAAADHFVRRAWIAAGFAPPTPAPGPPPGPGPVAGPAGPPPPPPQP